MPRRTPARSRPFEFREYHTPSSGIFFKAKKKLCSKPTAFQKIDVIETDSFGRVLFLDGLVQTTEKDEFFYHEMLVHPAMVSHPSAKEVLIIGGGDGGTLKEVLRHSVKKVVVVEIDGQVIEVSQKFFPWLEPSLRDSRVELRIADGNTFIQESERRFDVILIDSSDPIGPSAILHQREFFLRLKKRLKRGGIIAGQAGSPLYHLSSLREKMKFLQKIFKLSFLYLAPVPTYPGGLWSFVFVSDRVSPLRVVKKNPPLGLRYYNSEIHRAAFALPQFLK